MSTTNITIRIDENVKKRSQELFAQLGFDMSTAINMFLREALRENKLPLSLSLDMPNAETIAAIEEVKKMKENPEQYKGYTNVDEMMKDLLL